MSEVTVGSLAKVLGMPVEKLLEQLAGAGMTFSGPDQVVSSTEKMKLLGFLRRTHGKEEKPAEVSVPKKITLQRRKQEELTVSAGKTKSTVTVEVSRADDVLYLPSAAVSTAGGQSTVTVLEGGKPVVKTVTTGITGDSGVVQRGQGRSAGYGVRASRRDVPIERNSSISAPGVICWLSVASSQSAWQSSHASTVTGESGTRASGVWKRAAWRLESQS